MEVTFRPLTDEDLPMLHRWLNEPGVVRWWEGEDVSWDAVVADYGGTPDDLTEYWIAVVDGRDVGWIQCWDARDEPDEVRPWVALGVDPALGSIDYLIADPADRGRGMGAAVIRAFVSEVCFGAHATWRAVAVAPYRANVPSWRALEKAGLHHVGLVEDDDGPCCVMVVDRDEVLDRPSP